MKMYAVILALGALCTAYGMEGQVVVRYGDPSQFRPCPSGPYCYDAICSWYKSVGFSLYLDPYQPGKPYFAIQLPDYNFAAVPIEGPCAGHNMCDTCGEHGECEMVQGEPTCTCDEGYSGEYCKDKPEGGNKNIIIAVTVLGAVLVVFIILAIIAHLCWKNQGHSHSKVVRVPRQKMPSINLVNTGHPTCGHHVVQPAIGQAPCHCGNNIGFAPAPHVHHPTPSVRVSEIRDDGLHSLNTYVGGHGYNSVDNATRYTSQPHGPTVLTNLPAGVGTAFGGTSVTVG